MEQRDKYILLFNITFFLGYFFRILASGWMLIIFCIPEYLFRSFYYFCGLTFFDKELDLDKKSIRFNLLLQVFYVLASFFVYDGTDENSYTFAHLWINPPHWISLFWILFTVITLILLLVSINYYLEKKKGKSDSSRGLFKLLMGGLVIPALAIYAASFFLK